ncbi:hypothetical protein AYO44_05330 [Planctomycetaceae bacterium SCGC AG-212-F19]|nr:hypothetical protein AYO44_05330 [Planctomycetaceae bacterium SCGC AG-212-F19]
MAGVACFHFTSRAEEQEVARLGLSNGAARVVIPPGLDTQAWDSAQHQSDLQNRLRDQADGRPIILFLSRLHPKKGVVDLLLPAFAQLRADAVLAIAGGPDEHEPAHASEVGREVARRGLAGRVALLGPVAPQERWALYDAADLFVLPSHAENFGIVVTEAMARGLPVVISDAVQASEHVRAAKAGCIVPLDVMALARALDELLADEGQRRRMGDRGRAYVRTNLNWERVAVAIAAMYRTCRS